MYAQRMRLPEGKQCAAFITVNLSAEYFWISLNEKAKEMPKTLSIGQYGMTHGLPRLLKLFGEFGIKATFFVPGKVAETYPELIREVADRGHEIGCHGYEQRTLDCSPMKSSVFASVRRSMRLKKRVGKSRLDSVHRLAI